MTTEMSSRNPYGFDTYENDNTFRGKSNNLRQAYHTSTAKAQHEKPYRRLYNTATLSSARHEVYQYDPRAPNDSLDFVIKAKYNQTIDLFSDKNEIVFQPETFDDEEEHGRILKNRTKEVIVPQPFHPIRVVVPQSGRQSIHSIKNAIESSHSDATNPGYSRRMDGGFFSV